MPEEKRHWHTSEELVEFASARYWGGAVDRPPEVCIHCKRRIYYGVVVVNEWTHDYGGAWCLDARGFTSTPLKRATPAYHRAGDVL